MKIGKRDRPRWRCSVCGWTLRDPAPNPVKCSRGCAGHLRPAPSLAVERAERAVVRAAVAWQATSDPLRLATVITRVPALLTARTRARLANLRAALAACRQEVEP